MSTLINTDRLRPLTLTVKHPPSVTDVGCHNLLIPKQGPSLSFISACGRPAQGCFLLGISHVDQLDLFQHPLYDGRRLRTRDGACWLQSYVRTFYQTALHRRANSWLRPRIYRRSICKRGKCGFCLCSVDARVKSSPLHRS